MDVSGSLRKPGNNIPLRGTVIENQGKSRANFHRTEESDTQTDEQKYK